MSLEEDLPKTSSASSASTTAGTVSTALALLTSLRLRILAILENQPLRISLEVLDIMRPHRGGATNAHITFIGPGESDENRKLRAVCGLINTLFIQANLVEESTGLNLQWSLLNSVYRRPRAQDGRRVPFDFEAILASRTFRDISIPNGTDAAASQASRYEPTFVPPSSSAGVGSSTRPCQPVQRPPPHHDHGRRRELGTHVVDGVQICLMGSSGAEGEYVSVGSIRLDGGESGSGGGGLTCTPVLA